MAKKQIYYCKPCSNTWELAKGDLCPDCGAKGTKRKAWGLVGAAKSNKYNLQTGPKTGAGKAQQLKNLRENNSGPSGESAERSRLNAVKHGYYAKSPIFPVKFDRYAECKSCKFRVPCEAGDLEFCLVKTNNKLRKLAKFYRQSADRELLAAGAMANLHAILESSFEDVLAMGTVTEEITESAAGTKTIKYKAHPSLEVIVKMMTQLGFSAEQQQLTPKSQGEQGRDDALTEFLNAMMPKSVAKQIEAGKDMEVTF